jgi:hypothetical protein
VQAHSIDDVQAALHFFWRDTLPPYEKLWSSFMAWLPSQPAALRRKLRVTLTRERKVRNFDVIAALSSRQWRKLEFLGEGEENPGLIIRLPRNSHAVMWFKVGRITFWPCPSEEDALKRSDAWFLTRKVHESTRAHTGRDPWVGRVLYVHSIVGPDKQVVIVVEAEWYAIVGMCPRLKLPLLAKMALRQSHAMCMFPISDIAPVRIHVMRLSSLPPDQLVVFGKNFDFMEAGGWTRWKIARYNLPE